MTLYVVRHANAGRRSEWTGDDRSRPLSDLGRKQAAALALGLAAEEPTRILSSPATRCAETVEPLADAVAKTVVTDRRLFEGVGIDEVASFVADVGDEAGSDAIVCCTHGDVIPILLHHLIGLGMRPETRLVWEKASVWAIERSSAGWGAGRYQAPPTD